MRKGVNEAKLDFVQRRGRGIFVETKIKMFLAPSGAAYSGEMIFQKMPLLRSSSQLGNFSTKIRS